MADARRGLRRFGMVVALMFVALVAVALVAPQPVRAATITINAGFDVVANDGQCNFREAIISANTNLPSGAMAGECIAGSPGADTITTPGGMGAITLTSALPAVTENLTITAVGLYTIDGANLYRIFDVAAGVNFTIEDFTLINGRVTAVADGGAAIRQAAGGNLTVTNVTFTNNVALEAGLTTDNSGGAVRFTGTVGTTATFTGGTFTNNRADNGGAIFAEGGGTLRLLSRSATDSGRDSGR